MATALLLMSDDLTRAQIAAGLRERRIDIALTTCAQQIVSGEPAYDLAVVELALVQQDPCELCGKLREAGLPGLILIGERGRHDPADLLRAGADDYVEQPPGPAELIARVRSLLRRLQEYGVRPPAVMDLGEISVHCERYEVKVRGRSVTLTPKEFDLLRELARAGGELVERAELLERVWGTDDLIASRTLDVHVGRLRRKIEADPAHPRLIVTVPRLGYRIAA
jgi:two-component system response regulator RegX3